jgi:hypothetical protein
MSTLTHRGQRAAAPPDAEPGSRLCLPLRDVIARIDVADAHRAAVLRLHSADGGGPIDLPLNGAAGGNLRRLLAGAAARHFDTVLITRSPSGPVIGVCRRRHRSRT